VFHTNTTTTTTKEQQLLRRRNKERETARVSVPASRDREIERVQAINGNGNES